jgi:hypothetical protein
LSLILFQTSVRAFLKVLGVSRVQRTALNGLDAIGEPQDPHAVDFSIPPMDFAAFLLSFA